MLDDYRWLTGRDGARWLGELADDRQPSVALVAGLRKELSEHRVHLLLEQAELRRRAREKFSGADRMFFTRVGLEQATDQYVAAYKASRFITDEPLADLCCGIGGDLVALAERGPVTGLDRNPVIALLAEENIRALGSGGSNRASREVQTGDVAEVSIAGLAAWHVDPDRRPSGRRTTTPDLHDPEPAIIDRLLGRLEHAAVKLAPAAVVPDRWSQVAELEWISRRRQCRQLVVWFGRLAQHPARRRATIISGGKSGDWSRVRTLTGLPDVPVPRTDRVGRYVFEPDTAVLAAGLTGTLAEQHDLAAPAGGVGYLTADRPVSDPALACFEVTDVLPFDFKRLKRLLASRGVGRLEIKTRGVPLEVDEINGRLKLRGQEPAVLLVAPVGGRVTAIVAQRIEQGHG